MVAAVRNKAQAALLILCGAALLRISVGSELYLRYVQAGLRPYLIASGLLLTALGALSLARGGGDDHHDEAGPSHGHSHDHDEAGHSHDHSRGPKVGLLLAVPALALLLFPPPALGSYSANRQEAETEAQGAGTFPALPKGDPLDLTLGAFGSRAEYDTGASLKGRTLRLTGFVTRDGATWYVTRLVVTCCAADAAARKIEIRGTEPPVADTWVTVTGTWHPTGKPGAPDTRPVLDATEVTRAKQPSDPYEKR